MLGKFGERLGDRAALAGKKNTLFSLAPAKLVDSPTLRPILTDVAKALLFLMVKPFSPGDAVKLGSFSGTVHSAGVSYIVLRGPDKEKTYIPTHTLYTSAITIFK